MLLRIAVSAAVFAAVAAAQGAAQTKPMKDEKGLCQAAAPADATVVLSHMAQGPKSAYSLVLEHEGDKYDGPISAARLQEFHYSKAFENTAARYWVEKEAHAVTAGYRAFHVYVPAKTGRCHLGISFKATTPDEPLKRAAQSLSAVK